MADLDLVDSRLARIRLSLLQSCTCNFAVFNKVTGKLPRLIYRANPIFLYALSEGQYFQPEGHFCSVIEDIMIMQYQLIIWDVHS